MIDQSVLNELRELEKDSPGLLGQIIGMFLKNTPEQIKSLELAIAKKDAKDVSQIAHSLKSSCAYLGATAMRGLCERLEALGRAGTLADAPKLVRELASEYKIAEAELHSVKT